MSLLKNAQSMFSGEVKQREWYEELEENACSMCPTMTWQQRVQGCAICMLIGFLLSMGSLLRLMQLLEGDPVPFAIMYTLGNIIALSSTCFLYGPFSQAKKMFAATRAMTTIIYFVMMGLTLFLAFFPGYIPVRALWLCLSIFFQFLALSWYTLSFIPFGRDIVKNFFRETCGCDCCDWCPSGNTSSGGIMSMSSSTPEPTKSSSSWFGV